MKQPINRVSADDVLCYDEALQANADNALDAYQHLATRSAIYPGQGTPFGLMYAALGLAEAGEVQNKVKKIFRDDGVISFTEIEEETDHGKIGSGEYLTTFAAISDERRQQVAKEIGGLLWYAAACCNEIGMKLSEVAVSNLSELASRAQRGTLGGSGDDR